MKQYIKQYHLDHKEEVLKSKQKHYELNKDKINARRRELRKIKKEQEQKQKEIQL